MDRDIIRRMISSKQFWAWMLVFIPAFSAAIIVLDVFDVGTLGVFLAGIVFGEVSNRVVSWFTEWLVLEDRVDGRGSVE
mgnify:CR=1 FL=1